MYERRLLRLFVVFCLLLCGIFVRCFELQVVDRSDLTARTPDAGTLVLPQRGEILWADGAAMAWNDSRFRVIVDVARFDRARWRCMNCGDLISVDEAPRACAECGVAADFDLLPPANLGALVALVGGDPAEVDKSFAAVRADRAARVKSGETTRVTLASGASRVLRGTAVVLAARAAEFPGVEVRAEPARTADPTARPIVGSVRFADQEEAQAIATPKNPDLGLPSFSVNETARILVGSKGLERKYDEQLRGFPGLVVRFPSKTTGVRTGGEADPEPFVRHPVTDGTAVRTTVRKGLQTLANDIVDETVGTAASAVVIDLESGAVVAIASKSDDGLHHGVTPREPGSVYKLVTAMAELEAGLDTAPSVSCRRDGFLPGTSTKYRCSGLHGVVDFEGAFAHSCNPYYEVRGLAIGGAAMADAARRLGLDRNYGLGLAGESRRAIPVWDRNDLVNVAIGQGPVLVSPLQIAAAYGTVALQGRRVVPYLDRDAPRAADSGVVDPVIARHAARLRAAAAACVDYGTGSGDSLLRELRAAGKSGTAEVGPGKTLNTAWFVAFAPREAPRYVAVVVHEFVAKRHGGTYSGPAVGRLLEEALRER